MIRRNSLRTRMASQFGSRVASSFDKQFALLSKFLTNHYDAMRDDMIRVVDGDISDAPEFDNFAFSYEQQFGYPLDVEQFLLDLEAQHQRATMMILKENLAKLKAGKV